jgi:aminopeptidase N
VHPLPGRARRPRRLLVAATLTALLAGGVPAVAAGIEDPAAPVGAAGIGDPYYPLDGNGGIDVIGYEVHDSYRFRARHLAGWTRVALRATQDLAAFHLDFLLPVSAVEVDGRPVGHHREGGHELVVEAPLAQGEVHDVVVRYAGYPGRVAWEGERNWLASDREVVAMNQPHMATWWFPANDHPADKAFMDISITVPKERQVIANGRRVGRVVHGNLATTRWHADERMAPYLAFFAAGSFAVDRGTSRGLPWYVAVSKQAGARARADAMTLMRRTPGVVHWLEGELGAYPFSTTGGVTTALWPGFALENQTRPTYPMLGPRAVGLLVHELGHQWFGNSVSVARWRDIWLNEGAATWLQWRYAETHGGRSAQQELLRSYGSRAAGDPFWDVVVADPGRDDLFDQAVYVRGAMTFQALRRRLGPATFRTLLGTWLAEHRDGNGASEQFEALAEQVSGEDLDAFFQAWLRERARPARTAANGLV